MVINSTKIARLAQNTEMELELNELVETTNAVKKICDELSADYNDDIEKLKEQMKKLDDKLDKIDVLISHLEEHVKFRNGTMILEHTKLE